MSKKYILVVIFMGLLITMSYAGEDKEVKGGNQGYIFGGPLAEAQQRTEAIEQALDNQVYAEQGVVYVQPIQVVAKPPAEVKRPTIKAKDISDSIKKVDDWMQKNLW